MKTVSVRKAYDVDAANAYTVTVKDDLGGVVQVDTYHVHTGPNGRGLWVNGQQVEGNLQFRAGRNPAAAIRRYFS